MDASKASGKICIGDYICLYSEDSYGYMFSYQSSSAHNEIGVALSEDRAIPQMPNIQAGVFQICVQNRYKFNKELPRLKSEVKKTPNNIALRSQYNQTKSAAESENQDNEMEQKRQTGKLLLYGTIVQLKHFFTGKYIHANTNQTSWTETSNMLVELKKENAKTALFRVVPRYKVKSEGDAVQIGDQITLESMKSPGQFLHTSREVFGPRMVYSQSRELNLSVKPSGFSVQLHFKPGKVDIETRDNKVRGGSFLQLFHREIEAYLVSEAMLEMKKAEDVYRYAYEEGKFATQLVDGLTHLHFRIRNSDQTVPKTMYPSTSGITFWQIEKENCSIDGNTFLWEEQCRLKHVTTRKYLKIDDKGHVGLTSDGLDPSTVFKLHAVNKETEEVTFGSFVRIEHVVTNHWLHGTRKQPYKSKSAGCGDSNAMDSLSWTTAIFKEVVSVDEMMHDDAFTVQEVNQSAVQDANYVAGMVPFLHKLIYDLGQGLIFTPRRIVRVTTALKELSEFMLENGFPSKCHQKFLRNFMIVDLVVDLLKSHIKGNENEQHMHSVFSECYSLLYNYLRGDSRKNELYMAKHLEFFMTQLSVQGAIGLNAALMIMELVCDNRKMVDRITKKHISHFCKLLKKQKNYRYLDLLNVLCICDGIALPENQNYITEKYLVKSAKKQRDTVFYTELGQDIGHKKDNVYISTDNRRTWLPLHDFANKAFAQLGDTIALSTAEKSMAAIPKIPSSNSMKQTANRLPPMSQRDTEMYLFLEYQLRLFSRLCYGRNAYAIEVITETLKYLTWKEAFVCLSDERIPDQLRATYTRLILDLFIDVGTNYSVLDRLNLVFIYPDVPLPGQDKVERASSVLSDCVALPFIGDLKRFITDFLEKNQYMVASLIGRNKLIAEVLNLIRSLVEYGYYGDAADIKLLLEPLLALLDGRNDLPFPVENRNDAMTLITMYRLTKRFQRNVETASVVDAKTQALEIINLFFNLRFNIRLERFLSEFKLAITDASSGKKKFGPTDLATALNPDFVAEENLSLCGTMVNKTGEMFSETRYIKSEGFPEILLDLCEYKYDDIVTRAMGLLNRFYSSREILFSRGLQAEVIITEISCVALKKVHEHLPVLKLLSSNSKMNPENVEKLTHILKEFTELCTLPEDKEEAHCRNQKILYNHGLIADLFDILSRKIDSSLAVQYSGLVDVFRLCFELLRAMARDNNTVQHRLFDRLGTLLKIKGTVDGMAGLFIEIFRGNKPLCLRILAQHINEIVHLLAKSGKNSLVRLLSSLVNVGELPLKRNQTLVLKALLQHRQSVELVIDSTPEARIELIQSPEVQEGSGQELHVKKKYFCNIVQLLSFCAMGENRTAESICQCMFTVSELIYLMSLPDLCGGLRKGFIQFLNSVFLKSNSDLASTDMKDFPHNPDLWKYFDILSGELNEARKYASTFPNDARIMLKSKPTLIHKSKNDHLHELKELFHYIFDAALPFITIFLKDHYNRTTEDAAEEQHDVKVEQRAMNKLRHSMEQFSKEIHPCLTDGTHLNTLITAFRQLLFSCTEEAKFPDGLLQGLQHTEEDAKAKYMRYYATEEDMNKQLNTFSLNFKAAYGGFNTVKQQIGFPSDNEYTIMGSDAELPLGKEFQDLVSCFITTDAADIVLSGRKIDEKYKRHAKVQKVLRQLDNSNKRYGLSEKQKLDQETLDIKCFQVLRAMVHNQIVKLPGTRSSNKRLYDKQIHAIQDVQDAMVKLGIVGAVLPHMNRPGDNIPKEVIALLETLMFNGYAPVQNSFVEFFMSTREETFFQCVQSRMLMSATTMKERRTLTAQHKNLLREHEGYLRAKLHRQNSSKSLRSTSRRSSKSLKTMVKTVRFGSAVSTKVASTSATNKKEQDEDVEAQQQIEIEMDNMDNIVDTTDDKASLIFPNEPSSKKSKKPSALLKLKAAGEQLIENPRIRTTQAQVNEQIQEILEYRDTGYLEILLRLLALMCDGQNLLTQNYLREQKDNIRSINVIAETARFLQILYSSVNLQNISLATQLFDTLNEFCEGNHINQIVVFDQKVIDYANFILRRSEFPGCKYDEIYNLKKAIGDLIRTMIEENSHSGHALIIMESVNKDDIYKTMANAYSAIVDDPILSNEMKQLIQSVGFTYHHILCRCIDLDPKFDKEKYCSCNSWNYFESRTLSVELVKREMLQRIHFPVQDKNIVRNDIKEKVKWDIDRRSPTNKLQDFMVWCKDIRRDLHYQRKISSILVTRLLVRNWRRLNLLAISLSFLINILVLIFWIAPEQNSKNSTGDGGFPVYKRSEVQWSLLGIGIAHNIVSFLLLLSYLLAQRPRFPAWKKKPRTDDGLPMVLISQKSHFEVKLFGFRTLYYILFFVVSILGTVLSSSLFAFHLLHIAANNQLLSRVIKAVTLNGRSLLWVAFLGLIIIYIYALIGFAFLRDVFKDNDLFCTTMWECFCTMIREGLIYGLTERFDIQKGPNFTFKYYGLKMVFDVSFFVLITTIGLNIVFGIIVDTFSELRDSKGFLDHVRNEHNMWSYLYFFIHLDDTPKNNLTALELFVYRLMKENRIDFFPLGRALTLNNWEAENADSRLELLLEQVNILVSRMKSEDASKAREAQKKRQEAWKEGLNATAAFRRKSTMAYFKARTALPSHDEEDIALPLAQSETVKLKARKAKSQTLSPSPVPIERAPTALSTKSRKRAESASDEMQKKSTGGSHKQ